MTTLQRFQSLFLRDHAREAGLPTRNREISPAARALLLRQAWRQTKGPLWDRFHDTPGAAAELTRVVDWISQNRTGFEVQPGELGDHELARTYAAYIDLCRERRLLTFQESSLRCLDLLRQGRIAEETHRRFPVVLLDDLHLARPDQLALIAELIGPNTAFLGTAWAHPNHVDPGLRHVWGTIERWGDSEELQVPPPVKNAGLGLLMRRLEGEESDSGDQGGEVFTALQPPTVEDEIHTAAQRMIDLLADERVEAPADLLLVAADRSLLPVAERILPLYGLPIESRSGSARRNPLIRGAAQALRWCLLGPDPDLERQLLSLPYLSLDPLDLDRLFQSAEKRESTALHLPVEELDRLGLSAQSRRTVGRLREALEGLDGAASLADSLYQAALSMGALRWAWEDDAFPRAWRDEWYAAFSKWLTLVRELEEVAVPLGLERESLLEAADGLADEADVSGQPGGVRLVDPAQMNGIRGEAAFVVGLSESALPVQTPRCQLIEEDALQDLFSDGRPVVVPAARDHPAWMEREARRLAGMLSRAVGILHLSVSRYALNGSRQLPSPFFERILGDEGEIDRDGYLVLRSPRLWRLHEPSGAPVRLRGEGSQSPLPPAALLPFLDQLPSGPPREAADGAGQVLTDHTFSASQIFSYLRCPLQFFYGRVLRIEPEVPTVYARGSLVHEVLCAALGDGRVERVDLGSGPRPTWLDDGRELGRRARWALRAAWEGEAVSLPGGGEYQPSTRWESHFGPQLQRKAVRRWAESLIEDWAAFEVRGRPGEGRRRPVLLEVPFELELGGFRVRGRIDRVDEVETEDGPAYEILDYKTGSSGAGALPVHIARFLPAEGDPPEDYQLPLYALALESGVHGVRAAPRAVKVLNLEKLGLTQRGRYAAAAERTLRLVRDGELDRKGGRVPLEQIQGEVRQGITRVLQTMSHSPYVAQPDYYCHWCPFRVACDQGRAVHGGAR